MIRASQVSDLGMIDAEEWDALVGPLGFYGSYDWLRSQQRSVAATATYVLLEQDGRLIAAALVYDFAPGWEPTAPEAAGSARVLRAGPRTGYHNQLLVCGEDMDTRRARAAALIEALGELATRRGREALLFDHLTAADLGLLQGGFGARVQLRGAEGLIRIEGGTLDSYIRSFGHHARHRRAEQRRFAQAGFRVEVARLSECIDEAIPLIASTGSRYDADLPEDAIRDYLSEQARYVNDVSVVFRCLDPDGYLVGCAVYFVWRGTLYGRVAGFSYPQLRDAFEYFNTVFYEPVRYMERHNLDTLHVGTGSLDAKVRRGARLHSLWACVIPLPVRPCPMRPHDDATGRALAESAGNAMPAGKGVAGQ